MADWLNTSIDIINRLNTYSGTIEPAARSYDTVKVDTKAKDSRANNYLSFQQFNTIEYDSSHLWICKIDDAPGIFDGWVPAQSVSEPTKGLSVSSISFGIEEVNTLSNYNAVTLRAELLDDDKATLEQWIVDWQKNCAATDSFGRPYMGFKYLDDILKRIYITKYTWQKEKVYTHVYDVIPTGDITREHLNDPTLKVINVNFAVFGSSEI